MLKALRAGWGRCVSRTQFILDVRLRSWDLGQILDFCSTLFIMTPTGHLGPEGQKSSPAEGSPKLRWLVVAWCSGHSQGEPVRVGLPCLSQSCPWPWHSQGKCLLDPASGPSRRLQTLERAHRPTETTMPLSCPSSTLPTPDLATGNRLSPPWICPFWTFHPDGIV